MQPQSVHVFLKLSLKGHKALVFSFIAHKKGELPAYALTVIMLGAVKNIKTFLITKRMYILTSHF